MKKIAFIIVRYGENINGGAEVHCQMLAERLLPYYEVEVLTTTIRAFNHPDQDYTEGVSSWNGVTIRRFKPAAHRPGAIQALPQKIQDRTPYPAIPEKAEPAASGVLPAPGVEIGD